MASSILVIDDSQTIRTVVQMALQGAGYQVTASDTAEGGMHAARSAPPDLILLDYLLPDHTGDEVCRMLARDPRTAGIRILVLSAKGDELRARAASWPGVAGVMAKPFTSSALLARVAELFGTAAIGWTFDEQNAVAQAVFQALKPALREIPAWEAARGTAQASTFYAQRILTPAAIAGLMTTITPVMTDLLGRRAEAEAPALGGSLKHMPLGEVLRLLDAADRTGTLTLRTAAGRSVIHLDRGRVIGVAAPPESERGGLREAFPGLSETAIAEAIHRVGDEGLPAAVGLAGEPPPIPFERLRAYLRSAGERELERLWELDGSFAFRPGAVPRALARCEVVINPAQIALTRLRAVDDLAQIEVHAGRLDLVYERCPGSAHRLSHLALTDDERRVLALIDGIRDTAEVVRGTALGLLPVLRILFRFTRLGLIATLQAAAGGTPLLVVAAAGDVGEGRLGEALAEAWVAAGRGPARVVEPDTLEATGEAGGPAAVVVEIAVGGDPAAQARRLRQRLPPGIPLVALCLGEPAPTVAWSAIFDGILVPPLHLDDLSRLIAG